MNIRIFGTSLASKARILVFNVTCGLLSLSVVSYVFYFSVKYDYDELFLRYTESLVSLEDMRQKLYQDKESITQMRKEEILTLWEKYKEIQSQLQNHNSITKLSFKIYGVIVKRTQQEIICLQEREKKVRNLDNQIYKLLEKSNKAKLYADISSIIKNEVQIAELKKNYNARLHEILHAMVLVMMLLIIATTLLLSFLILKGIKTMHNTLEDKVREKTKALQELNDTLHLRIKKEVEDSQKKDQIMYQQARLASMGEMIGNIAHQWRQPLNALMLLIQAFQIKAQNGKLTQEFIDNQVCDGLRIAKQMSNTIEDFRNFFSLSCSKESFDLKDTLENSISLINVFLQQNEIKLILNCAENIEVFGYKSALSQVILNLIKNSEDILKERKISKGLITISVFLMEGKQQGYVKILLLDNAGGIDSKNIEKIFEPYFTTKHKSVGTGIGLYMSKQIIEKQMQGSIEVRNAKEGAEFTILIPRSEDAI